MMMDNNFTKAEDFNDEGFWDKTVKYAKKAGCDVIEQGLWLYFAAQKPDIPVWAKTAIYGALAYFVLPIDAIPDAVPVAGYTDDLGVLTGAVAAVGMHIDKDVKQQAKEKMSDWFD
ncbi:YkvA family protein [Pectobacterium brasiliense]|uniref:YkvA family protein n=2 Tax=Pectobacteriaceae TaxID=1903410 RepID=UPI003CEADB04